MLINWRAPVTGTIFLSISAQGEYCFKFPTVLFVVIANFQDQYFISICKRGEGGGGATSMIFSTRVVVLPLGGQLDIAIQWRGVDTEYARA